MKMLNSWMIKILVVACTGIMIPINCLADFRVVIDTAPDEAKQYRNLTTKCEQCTSSHEEIAGKQIVHIFNFGPDSHEFFVKYQSPKGSDCLVKIIKEAKGTLAHIEQEGICRFIKRYDDMHQDAWDTFQYKAEDE